MNKLLIVVDMQNDFIGGSLGTDEAKGIVDKVREKIIGSMKSSVIFFTMDTHDEDYLGTAEGRKLPVLHCIHGTHGWLIAPCLLEPLVGKDLHSVILQKNTFGSVELAERMKALNQKEKIEEIEIVGLCTDICVISNALMLKAFLPEAKITVDSACCAGVTKESHNTALAAMKMCHIDIV